MKRIKLLCGTKPDRPPVGYRDHYVLYENDVTLNEGHCSSCPNPFKPSDRTPWRQAYGWIAPGIHTFKCIIHHKYGKCLLINENGEVAARYPNVNHEGRKILTGVLCHIGGFNSKNKEWRGSAGCITFHENVWSAFISYFEDGEVGEIEITDFVKEAEGVHKVKRILSLDGGGVKGIMTAYVLMKIEEKTGSRICDTFDMITGSSVGSILGAIAASGKVTMTQAYSRMNEVIPELFTRARSWPMLPKYSRKPFVHLWNEMVGSIKMSECKTKFMSTSVNMCDGLTHYFKSWEDKDGYEQMLDVVLRSFAAPVFFGTIVDKSNKSVWMDGGTGGDNCTLLESVIEALRQGWLGDEPVHILSIGAGYSRFSVPFDEAKRYRSIRQAFFFADPIDGGLARNQSIPTRVEAAKSLLGNVEKYSFQRVDSEISRECDVLDGFKYMGYYNRIAKTIADQVEYDRLK